MNPVGFELLGRDGLARRGRLRTPHGFVETPAFMTVGTQATVKGLLPNQLEALGTPIILGNTYHLALRPGADLIAEQGGLHRFMGWRRAILTDSGGYQIYSLAAVRRIDDHAALFRSHIDGAEFELSPEKAVAIQAQLGSDIAMCLDECPPSTVPSDRLADAVRRTILWAKRCRDAQRREGQALFGIVQGGMDLSLRERCAFELGRLDLPGYALGGFSVGEKPEEMVAILKECAAMLPEDKPRYLMGVGRPEDILDAIARGIDLFDCVLPTRNGRNAQAFTSQGLIRLRNACHKRDSTPLDPACSCYTCLTFGRSYLHHLFAAEEMLGPILVSLHNVAYYVQVVAEARRAIEEGRFQTYHQACNEGWNPSSPKQLGGGLPGG